MYFIKKNWGLLLSVVIFLAVVTYLTIKIFSNRSKYNSARAQEAGIQGWFNQVNSDGWKILGSADNRLENAERARYNKDVAVGHYADIQRELLDHFSFKPELPNTSTEAQDWLAEEVDKLTEYAIAENRVSWHEDQVGGRFCDLAEQDQPIMKEDFPAVFRQLMIYGKLVRHIVNAGVKNVNDLYFPRWLATEDAGEHTVTPVVMDIEADAETLQKLVNNMLNDPTMLFFVRNMKFTAISEDIPEEEYTQVVLERSDVRTQRTQARRGNKGGKNDTMGGTSTRSTRSRGANSADPMGGGRSTRGSRSSRNSDAMGMDTGRKSSSRERRSSRNSGIGMDGAMGPGMAGGTSNVNEADLVYEEPTRRDFLVLRTPRQIGLELTLDLIEFKAPESDADADAETED